MQANHRQSFSPSRLDQTFRKLSHTLNKFDHQSRNIRMNKTFRIFSQPFSTPVKHQ